MAGRYDDIDELPLPSRSPGRGRGGDRDRGAGASLLGGGGKPRSDDPRYSTFEVELFGAGGGGGDDDDEDDDGMLLDWERHHAARRWACCGLDCGCCARWLPESLQGPPDWWYRLSLTQRRVICYGSLAALVALLIGAFVIAPARAAAGGAGGGRPGGAEQPEQRQAPPDGAAGGGSRAAGAPRARIRADAGTSPYCSWNQLYLPQIARPDHYDLRLATDLRSAPFEVTGSVRIRLAPVSEVTPCLVVHSKGPNIKSARLIVGDEVAGDFISGVMVNTTEYEQVVLVFSEAVPLAPAVVTLQLDFSYWLVEGLDGFYKSSYRDAAGKERVMASTHFESLGARKAFPCFDEPALKATYDVTLTVPPAPWVALSNMPPDAPRPAGRRLAASPGDGPGDLVTYTFQRSPPMASYLVAFVVGELSHVTMTCEAGANGSLPVSVWATPDRAGQLGTAMSAACSCVRTYERLLSVPYSLPKLDLVGVPNFAAGAMENWGLIMYRESRLLVDPKEGDVTQEYDIAIIVAHEVAHMWFGDLVTLKDWNELWLNEGFASYFEYVGADGVYPDHHYFDFFLTDDTAEGLQLDEDPTGHPLSKGDAMTNIDDIDNQFDDISYSKGGAVLRMLRAFLNGASDAPGAPLADALGAQRMRLLRRLAAAPDPDTSLPANLPRRRALLNNSSAAAAAPADPFMNGLSSYLRARAFNTSTYSDLWGAMANATGRPVDDWMRVWTLRRGFPILAVDPPPKPAAGGPAAAGGGAAPGPAAAAAGGSDASSGGGAFSPLALAQLPFHAPRSFEVGTPYTADMYCNDWSDDAQDSSWWLPVAFVTADAPGKVQWHAFNTCDTSLPIAAPAGGGHVIVNAGRTGFYRVNYSEPLWEALIAASSDEQKVPKIDLAGSLDDAFALSLSRQLGPSVFLRLTQSLGARRVPEYAPWRVALTKLQRMRDLFATAGLSKPQWAECASSLSDYVVANVTGPFISGAMVPNQAGAGLSYAVDDSQPTEVRLLRPAVLQGAGLLGDKQVTAEAVKLLAANAQLHPDVRAAVYRLGVASGDAGAYDAVVALYKEERSAPKKDQLLRALSYARSEGLIRRTLEFALTADVRSQDVGRLLSGVALRGGLGFNMTWQFIFDRADDIAERFQDGSSMYSFGRRLNDLAPLFTDDATLDAVRAFAKARPGVLSPTLLGSAAAALQRNQDWLRRQGGEACAWLKAAAGGGGAEAAAGGAESAAGGGGAAAGATGGSGEDAAAASGGADAAPASGGEDAAAASGGEDAAAASGGDATAAAGGGGGDDAAVAPGRWRPGPGGR